MKLHICFRIVEVDDKGNYKTLFHALNGSRILPRNKWLKAVQKQVTDGDPKTGTVYVSGFHVLKTREDAYMYLRKFKKIVNKRVIPVCARGLRLKTHAKMPVYLASEIYLTEES